eukprot:7380329-Prymnesium_polylepis.2
MPHCSLRAHPAQLTIDPLLHTRVLCGRVEGGRAADGLGRRGQNAHLARQPVDSVRPPGLVVRREHLRCRAVGPRRSVLGERVDHRDH